MLGLPSKGAGSGVDESPRVFFLFFPFSFSDFSTLFVMGGKLMDSL